MEPVRSAVILVLFSSSVFAFNPLSYGRYAGEKVLCSLGKLYPFHYKLECCDAEHIPHNIELLSIKLNRELFGQHIVNEQAYKAISSHYESKGKSKKPLVMTFHGTPGTGKNYVSEMIAEAVFQRGTKSKYFHLFHGSQYEHIDEKSLAEHKKKIRDEVIKAIDDCAYSIFVFDEVDKMPPGIFDSITAFLDHHSGEQRDFKKAIFIFLTNYGGDEISKMLYRLTYKEGLYREESKLNHFEKIIQTGVYYQKGGLKETTLIKSAVIDFYIPFLPLEEKHVIECIKAEFEYYQKKDVSKELINEVLKYIGFDPNTKYAYAGCKTVNKKVETLSYN